MRRTKLYRWLGLFAVIALIVAACAPADDAPEAEPADDETDEAGFEVRAVSTLERQLMVMDEHTTHLERREV
jgi:hypothetical protein